MYDCVCLNTFVRVCVFVRVRVQSDESIEFIRLKKEIFILIDHNTVPALQG